MHAMTEILYSYHEPIHSVTRLVSCKKTSYGGEEVERERDEILGCGM